MSQEQYEPRVWRNRFKKALVLENPHPSLDTYLEGLGIEVERINEPPTQDDELIELLRRGRHNLIFKRSRVQITERLVKAAPDLFGVMLCCIGDDSVDKMACAQAGIMVINDPISNGRSVAEMVLGEIICLSRRIFEAAEATEDNRWTKSGADRYEINGKTLGIVGLGNIGKQVAQLGQAMGMKIVFFDNREVAREVGRVLGWHAAKSVKEVFELSHVLTMHLSATDYSGRSNENILTREMFMSMSQDVEIPGPRIFINAARGFIYEPDDLVAAVEAGKIDYACVDVFPREPHHKSEAWTNPYAGVPGIYATPHIGAATQEAQPRIARHVAGSTRLFSHFGRVRNCIYSPKYPIGVPEGEQPSHILAVVHSDRRGTKKAIDETIYDAGLSNLSSVHKDFAPWGIAYDVNVIDGGLSQEQIQGLIDRTVQNTGDPTSIRSVRMIEVGVG